MNSMEEELREALNKVIDLTIVHHVEGITRITTGKLIEVTQGLIKLELEWKEHFWSRRTSKAVYICNRKASSVLSICVRAQKALSDAKKPAVDLRTP